MTWRFEIGDPVRARAAKPTGHCRTPFYLRGKRGVVVRRLGEFPNPEELVYHRPGLPAQLLYQVEFAYDELWGSRLGRPRYTHCRRSLSALAGSRPGGGVDGALTASSRPRSRPACADRRPGRATAGVAPARAGAARVAHRKGRVHSGRYPASNRADGIAHPRARSQGRGARLGRPRVQAAAARRCQDCPLSGFLGIDLLIVAPHLVGAPEAPLSASIDGGNIVRQLWLFAYLANALFWVLLGAFVGLLHAEEGK
jgi:nitrile hydratase subunit beta